MKKIYVEGQTGTTGLEIHERLKKYTDIEILKIDYEKRHDLKERARCLNEADIVFLCLPDDAAKESVSLVENPNVKIIDPSTAHRISKDWAYGLPELSAQHRENIINSKRVTVPGCHASAFVLSIFPLVKHKIMQTQHSISFSSITGYSGGGKALIEKYEQNSESGKNPYTLAPRPYALGLNHKHLPEMMAHTGLVETPVFMPVLGNFYRGLVTTVPIHTKLLAKKMHAKDIHEVLSEHYANQKFVQVKPYADEAALFDGVFDVMGCNNTNRADIFVFGNEANNSALIMTRLDNLGKGASGAAIQNMNLLLGLEETMHLI